MPTLTWKTPPTPTSREEDIAQRGKDHLVVDHSGRVIWLKAATVFEPYIPPESAPLFSVVGKYPNHNMCALL
jgi:hypothetical protein